MSTGRLTHSQDRGATTVPLIEQTIGDLFDAVVKQQPDHEALVSVHQGQRYSYAQLHARVEQLSSALLQLGLVRGDRVGIWC
jgi:fatty-acyl-CoA synthase